MTISPVIQSHLKQLRQHPHVDEILEIKPFVYKVTYWPRSLESLYAEIPYTLKLSIPQTYPDKPPFITFLDPIYHLNIHPSTGQLNMSILGQDWSPFLNLKAIINSLDEILQQPDETSPASTQLLEQYQNDITMYVDNVKGMLASRMHKDGDVGCDDAHQQELINGLEQQVQSVIQVDDFSGYKITNNPATIISPPLPSLQNHQNDTKSLHLLDLEQHNSDYVKQHDYSFNNDAVSREGESNDKKSNYQQSIVKAEKQSKQDGESVAYRQKSVPVESSSNYNKRTFINNINNKFIQQSPQTKYKTLLNTSQPSIRKLPLQQDKQQLSYERLKQNMIRCKQLITIFSTELNEMQRNIEQSKSKRIKKILQQKCVNLEQMIMELFEINQKNQNKLMEFVRFNE